MTTMWGIHNDALGAELVEEGFISISWEEMPDLRTIGDSQTRMKDAVGKAYPAAKPGAIPVWAGVLRRFAFDMKAGDLVIAPYKSDSTLNFGVVDGPYEYHAEVRRHPHRRRVRWLKTGVARGLFPQAALYEIGSAITLFQVKKNAKVFESYIHAQSDEGFEQQSGASRVPVGAAEAAVFDEPNAERIDQHTRDFVSRMLLKDLSDREFEEFTADLLRALGYQARVTPYAGDGGIDVIAHKDALGVEPPIIRSSASTPPEPMVDPTYSNSSAPWTPTRPVCSSSSVRTAARPCRWNVNARTFDSSAGRT